MRLERGSDFVPWLHNHVVKFAVHQNDLRNLSGLWVRNSYAKTVIFLYDFAVVNHDEFYFV